MQTGRMLITVLFAITLLPTAAAAQKRRGRRPDARTSLALRVAAARAPTMTPAQRVSLRKVVALWRAKKNAAAKAAFKRFSQGYFTKRNKKDMMAVIHYVLRRSYLEPNSQLRAHADKVRAMNETKAAYRKYLDALRKIRVRPGNRLRWRSLSLQRQGEVIHARPGTMTDGDRQQLEAAVAKAESDMERVRNERQLANSSFENAMQKQQQLAQILSTVLKACRDAAMSVIRNLL